MRSVNNFVFRSFPVLLFLTKKLFFFASSASLRLNSRFFQLEESNVINCFKSLTPARETSIALSIDLTSLT